MKFIYLHGFCSGPGSTKARFFRDRFAAEGRELLVPDLAAGDFEHLTVTGQLAVVESTAKCAPAVLIGSSLGGYLAGLYAARHPEVARVLLLAPAFGFARRWPQTLDRDTLARWRHTGWLDVYHYGARRTCRLSHALLEDAEQYEDFPAFSQPALIFHGRGDSVVQPAWSQEFVSRHPGATLRLLDSDHELLDVVERIWDQARTFLLASD